MTWSDDLFVVRGMVSQFQASFNLVVSKAPSQAQYKRLMKLYGGEGLALHTLSSEDTHLAEKLRTLLTAPQIKVAVHLKRLFQQGHLPFLLLLAKINLKQQKSDQFLNFFLDMVPPKNGLVARELNALEHDAKVDPLPLPVDLAPHASDTNTPGFSGDWPPVLPHIDDALLLRLALTDKLARQPLDYLESSFPGGCFDYNNNHNRKLALRGAAALDLQLLDVLDARFPKMHEDDLVYLRTRLTSTAVVAKIAFAYGLPEKAVHGAGVDLPDAAKVPIFANLFRAYVGGLVVSGHGRGELAAWLLRLYQPLLERVEQDEFQNLTDAAAVAHAELAFMLRRVSPFGSDGPGRLLFSYNELETDPFVEQLVIGDEIFGIGTAPTAAEAKRRAAYETIHNAELKQKLATYVSKHFAGKPEQKEAPVATEEDVSDENYEPLVPELESDTRSPAGTEPVPPPAATPAPPTIPKGPAGANGSLPIGPTGYQRPEPPRSQAPVARMPLPYGALPPIGNKKQKWKY